MAAKKPAPEGKQPPPPRPRVVGWLEELTRVGDNMEKAKGVFNKVRSDVNANRTDKEHFYRTLAQQSLIWYMGAIRGKPLTGEEIKVAALDAVAAAKAAARKPAGK
jgi:hypothetical protein